MSLHTRATAVPPAELTAPQATINPTVMRRRYNSAPGFLHQQHQQNINITNYHVGIFNQYLGGPDQAPGVPGAPSALQQNTGFSTDVNNTEYAGPCPIPPPMTGPVAIAPSQGPGQNNYATARNSACNIGATVRPDCTAAGSIDNDISSNYIRGVHPQATSSSSCSLGNTNNHQYEQASYQPSNTECTQQPDWNSSTSTPAASTSFIPIPSPLPWSVCTEQQQNSTSMPSCQWAEENDANNNVPGSRPMAFSGTQPQPSGGAPCGASNVIKPKACHSMYPNADLLSQHYLTLLQQVFPEHSTTALQHVLDRCGGDIINALENILACHAYKDHLLKTCMSVLNIPSPGTKNESGCGSSDTPTVGLLTPSEPETQTTDSGTSAAALDDLWSPQSAQLLTQSDLGQLQDLSQSETFNSHAPPTAPLHQSDAFSPLTPTNQQ